jgi:hypothetical protein
VAVEEIIDRARGNREKAIVFVTGVPRASATPNEKAPSANE